MKPSTSSATSNEPITHHAWMGSQVDGDHIRELVMESKAVRGGVLIPTLLSESLSEAVLRLAGQEGFKNPKLAQRAVPTHNAQFPGSLLLLDPLQVPYVHHFPSETRFSCNSRFCVRPRERLMTAEDFLHQSSAFCTCGNFMHRECHNLWDRERPMNNVCGWCTEGINRTQRDDILRALEAQRNDESQSDARLAENPQVFKYDMIPMDQFHDRKDEKRSVECYICRKKVDLPPQIVFPFHRSYSGYGGRTKGEEKGRKQAESKASHALHTHNFASHRVDFRGEKILVHMFETFKRLEIDDLDGNKFILPAVVYAVSFTKVRLEARHLTDNPFSDCALYFDRWKNYIQSNLRPLVLNEQRNRSREPNQSGKKREREMPETTDREDRPVEKKNKKNKREREIEANNAATHAMQAVTKVVAAVKELLLEERTKPDANFVDEGFQETLRQCIAKHSRQNLGCSKKALQFACMIQRRMLALPLLYKEVQRDVDEVPNSNGNVQEPNNNNSN